MARTDVQLMLDVKAGDERSFELLLRKYRTPLVNFLYRMVRDTAVAEDLAQEVFLRVYRARQEYAPSAKFTTWMFRIATNLALNSVRDNRHRQMEISMDQTVDAGEDEQRPIEVPDRAPTDRAGFGCAKPLGNDLACCPCAAGKTARGGACCTSIRSWITMKSRAFWSVRRVR